MNLFGSYFGKTLLLIDFFDNIDRRRNWPDPAVVETIKKFGCHFTPKTSTENLVNIDSRKSC